MNWLFLVQFYVVAVLLSFHALFSNWQKLSLIWEWKDCILSVQQDMEFLI